MGVPRAVGVHPSCDYSIEFLLVEPTYYIALRRTRFAGSPSPRELVKPRGTLGGLFIGSPHLESGGGRLATRPTLHCHFNASILISILRRIKMIVKSFSLCKP